MYTARLAALVVALFQAGPSVRFEKEGVWAGDQHFVGSDEGAVDIGKVPALVSGRSVRNLSTKGQSIEAAILPGEAKITLGPGMKLQREEKRFRLSADRGKMELSAGGKTLQPKTGEVVFEVTAQGFDFGKLGLLEGTTLAATSRK